MPRNSIDADQWAPRPLKTEEEEKEGRSPPRQPASKGAESRYRLAGGFLG